MANKKQEQTPEKNDVHFILQGKGGVGKSYVASLLAQYILSKGRKLMCVDTDPVNATFAKITSLKPVHVDVLDDKKANVVQRKFDAIMEKVIAADSNFVIDNGSSSFLPLTAYLAENGIYELLKENGKNVYIHNVLIMGPEKDDTVNGFMEITERASDAAKIVVWENQLRGPFQHEGKTFTQLNLYQDNKDKVAGVVKIAEQTSDTFITDIKQMTSQHLTYDDVKESTEFGLIAKSRLFRVVNDVFIELDKVAWMA